MPKNSTPVGWGALMNFLTDGVHLCDEKHPDPRCSLIVAACNCGLPHLFRIFSHRAEAELVCPRCGPLVTLRLHDDSAERAAIAADVARQVEELAHGG